MYKYNTGSSLPYTTTTTTYGANSDALTAIGIWTIVALVLAVVGGILLYFLFVKGKNEPKGKFAKWLKDFLSFKIMWIEAFAKIFYYMLTIFAILLSFSFLTLGGMGFLMFICTLVLAPIFIRIGYESFIMFIMVWRNTRDIAENTKKK
ncbi:hypothetical protein IJI94_00410 [Candidatus Saccharibacteria bacterium]|nr:hypothetical protein [Candidatus Saccharibacteria bacterium]